MPKANNWSVEKPHVGVSRRAMHALARRIKRRVLLPGDSLVNAVKRVGIFVVGWGTLIALLTLAGYHQGYLHGVGDGITFCVLFFLLAVIFAPNYTSPPGSSGGNQY